LGGRQQKRKKHPGLFFATKLIMYPD